MKIKSIVLLIISVLFIFMFASCKDNSSNSSVDIFSGGKTDYTIVITEGASEEEQALAKELATLSGANLEIVTDSSAEKSHEILIGNTNRAQTQALVPDLESKITVSAFNYIVAEKDQKLVILSDSNIGYVYALDYIKTTYLENGNLSITKDVCDIQQIAWDVYYNSDLYYDRLVAEADKDRFDFIKDQLDKETGRYDDNGNSITTVADAIHGYKKLISSFESKRFGAYSASVFTSKDVYDAPTVYPDEAHPRILFRESDLPELRENLLSEQNAVQYKKYIALSNASSDGLFVTISGDMKHNYSYDIVARIEAKAYRYIMEKGSDDPAVAAGAVLFGYEAIYALKNAILSIYIPDSIGDATRAYTHLMFVAACVYDWCYDLLTEEDKTQIIHGTVNLLGKHLEAVRYDGVANLVPSSQNPAFDHGAEYQVLQGYFGFAIACYDKAPEIYEFVGGRVLNDYAEYQNFLAQSGSHHQGVYYAAFREPATIFANLLVKGMKEEEVELPFKYIEELAITHTYYYRPDGYIFMIGDVNQEQGRGYNFVGDATYMLLAGNLYKNPYLKSYAYLYSDGFENFLGDIGDSSVYKGNIGISTVQFLAITDPEVDHVYDGDIALTRTTTYPYTNLFAKSANDDPNAYSIYMTMHDLYGFGHGHFDCGSFQIYYKGGILASDSGGYIPWGNEHHMGYAFQTIASNSILVYNPKYTGTFNSTYSTMIYSGGQSINTVVKFYKTLADFLAAKESNPRIFQCTSLGKANVENNQEYLYSYIGGDMTNAYDQDTVDEVTRYMFSVATGNELYPYVFLTFDRITSDDASFKKTALIHTEKEPVLTSDGYAYVINGDGKLVIQSVGFDTTYTLVGGEGNEFNVNGTNIPDPSSQYGNKGEYGWGRIEISPEVAEKTNHMLTVMYVTDAKNGSAHIKATEIISENLAGAHILGKTVLFSKNEKLLSEQSSFTLSNSGECFIAGVSAGTWTITGAGKTTTVTVEEGTNLISFTANAAGTYTITPAN